MHRTGPVRSASVSEIASNRPFAASSEFSRFSCLSQKVIRTLLVFFVNLMSGRVPWTCACHFVTPGPEAVSATQWCLTSDSYCMITASRMFVETENLFTILQRPSEHTKKCCVIIMCRDREPFATLKCNLSRIFFSAFIFPFADSRRKLDFHAPVGGKESSNHSTRWRCTSTCCHGAVTVSGRGGPSVARGPALEKGGSSLGPQLSPHPPSHPPWLLRVLCC